MIMARCGPCSHRRHSPRAFFIIPATRCGRTIYWATCSFRKRGMIRTPDLPNGPLYL